MESLKRLGVLFTKKGIFLGKGKKVLVRSRLGKILRRRKIPSFKKYYKLIVGDTTGQELTQLLNAISTNFTQFFREREHFEFLKEVIIPNCSQNRQIKIWLAGCSSGEEPYSIVITLLERVKDIKKWNIRILATDISTRVLEKAIRELHQEEQFKRKPPACAGR